MGQNPASVSFQAEALDETLSAAKAQLMAWCLPSGHWEGELSSSALSTATATVALTLLNPRAHRTLIERGLDWLAANQNADGGWGDTVLSKSNLSTTALAWAAFAPHCRLPIADCQSQSARGDEGGAFGNPQSAIRDPQSSHEAAVARAEAWLTRAAGGLDPDVLAPAIVRRYGKDRTFSVPILTTLALTGRLGKGRRAWRWVIPLPFELAACPHGWFKWLRLPVVSYALPALIAIGQARYHHRPPANPVTRCLRHFTRRRTLEILAKIQPESGGFLEAVPLTSFVLMSLASIGQSGHPVAVRGTEFLARTARRDGSWPIDTNLATWVTTLAVNALAPRPLVPTLRVGTQCPGRSASSWLEAGEPALRTPTRRGASRTARSHAERGNEGEGLTLPKALEPSGGERLLDWLLGQQLAREHPYTHAAPGGWAWTDLSGGVPDADDTAGALLSLRHLAHADSTTTTSDDEHDRRSKRVLRAAERGVAWLLGLQNRDGGIPTFCRGWGTLPFDRSAPDLTAHALHAWATWLGDLSAPLRRRAEAAMHKAISYLARSQAPDGAWMPLWFGNEAHPTEENPTYGTSRVLLGLGALARSFSPLVEPMVARGARWLLSAQNADGGWGGAGGIAASIEETALAVEALAALLSRSAGEPEDQHVTSRRFGTFGRLEEVATVTAALGRGAAWLVEHTERGRSLPAAPIGFYFAKLGYFERLYPVIFVVSALGALKSVGVPASMQGKD